MSRKPCVGLMVWFAVFPHVAAFGLLGAEKRAGGQPVSLAAASDLVFCLDELRAQFGRILPDVTVTATIGSSGNFFAQIQRGAPFDIFLSADTRYPEELIRLGRAEALSLTRYAVGRIVLWTMRTNLFVTNGLSVLADGSVRKFAMASPEHAPYGRAARAALETAGLWPAVQKKVVLGENIAQTAQFVETGNVDAGIIALSLVSAPKLKHVGSWWLVPEAMHPRLEQAAVLTNRGSSNSTARAYLEFLRSKAAREVFDRFGFQLPPH